MPTTKMQAIRTKSSRITMWKILWPILCLIGIYPMSQHIDLTLSRYAFNQELGRFTPPEWCSYVYVWGLIPGQIVFLLATCITLIGLFYKPTRSQPIWQASVYLFFVLAIGSGLIAHGICKENFARARPKQLEEFGGTYSYSEPLTPYVGKKTTPDDRLRSMPSGHATMGFYFISFWFIGTRWKNRLLSWSGICIGMGLGITLVISRLLEGGHFLSDGLASFVIMWYTSLILDLIWQAPKEDILWSEKYYHQRGRPLFSRQKVKNDF